MVDTVDLFRRLSSGAKYDRRRLSRELAVFQGRRVEEKGDEKSIAAALDFFGDSSAQEEEGLPPDIARKGSDSKPTLGKREHGHHDDSSDDQVEEEPTEVEGQSDGGEEESGKEEDVTLELLSGHAPLSGRKRRKKGKKRRLDRETRAVLKRQEANAFRNAHRIYVSGSDIPDTVAKFEDLKTSYNLPSYILKNIATVGYKEPTPIQMQAIPLMLHGREVLGCAPTGSGKTAAFIIPILAHLKEPRRVGFRAVVVSPTRELAQQTYRECVRLSAGSGFKVHVLTKAKASANSFGPQSSQRFDILVTTPNRLVHMLAQQPPAIQLHNVEWLVLDESDKLFEDGTLGFRDQVAQIYSACDNPNVKHALFSATLGSGVEEFCHAHLDTPVRIIIGLPNSATDTIKQELLFVGQESGKLLAIRDIIRKGFSPPVLVFVQSIERAKELFHELIYDGLNVEVMHSERTQAQRDNIIKCFRSGKIWILICTNLMGRGIDFKGVNLVLNYDFPQTAISYIHRIGRTGRAGRQGRAVTFFTEDDAVSLRSIANVMQSSGCEVPEWMLRLRKPSK